MQTVTQRLANPTVFMSLSARLLPWLTALASALLLWGLFRAFFATPPDEQHGMTVMIMFVHVPAAWLGMMGYGLVAISSFGLLVFRHPLADVSAKAAVPIGAAFTLLALVTGSLWGKPGWGTYWVWDARLTSMLILLFLFMGLMALRSSLEDEATAGKQTAILAIVGSVILPIIKFSVVWWNTLHQGASIMRSDGPSMDSGYLLTLLLMTIGFSVMFFAMHMKAMRNEILRRRVIALRRIEVEQAANLDMAAASLESA